MVNVSGSVRKISGARNSFQAFRKVNSATTESAGRDRGKITRQKMANSLQPSMRAASESSLGMVRKNWRKRKILNAPPKNDGTQSGKSVPIQPKLRNTPYSGTIKTGNGTIIVARVMLNSVRRPFHWMRDRP